MLLLDFWITLGQFFILPWVTCVSIINQIQGSMTPQTSQCLIYGLIFIYLSEIYALEQPMPAANKLQQKTS